MNARTPEDLRKEHDGLASLLDCLEEDFATLSSLYKETQDIQALERLEDLSHEIGQTKSDLLELRNRIDS